jgi:flavin-dependent dehydrogenase
MEADFAESAEVELYFGNTVAPGSFTWVVPLQRDGQPRARIGLMADTDVEGYFLRFLQSQPIHARLRDGPVTRFRRRPIPLAPLRRTFGERVLVVGDAAGLTKPTTGGGIYYSLLSAELAASVAHKALAERSYSAEFLSQYQQAWESYLGSELWWGSWFRRQAERFTDAQIDEAFQLAAREPVARVIQERATFNWHRGLIQALVRHRQVRSVLFRVFVGRSLDFVRRNSERVTALPPLEESEDEVYQP